MNQRSAGILLSILALFVAVPSAAQGPELSLPGLEGGTLSEAELSQCTHIIVFWVSWAPRGRDVVERVNELVDRWARRARVLTINFQEDESAVRGFLSGKANLEAEVFLDHDGELSKKYRVNSAPWLLILKDGRTSFSERLPTDPNPVIDQILG